MALNKPLILPDTSTLLKWLVHESDLKNKSHRLREQHLNGEVDLLIPALTIWEINNFLGRNFDPDFAAAVFSTFQSYKIPKALLSLEETFLAFKIMKKCPKVSFYDTSYHALAISLNGTFLTADKKYFQKAKGFKHIKLLSKY